MYGMDKNRKKMIQCIFFLLLVSLTLKYNFLNIVSRQGRERLQLDIPQLRLFVELDGCLFHKLRLPVERTTGRPINYCCLKYGWLAVPITKLAVPKDDWPCQAAQLIPRHISKGILPNYIPCHFRSSRVLST